MTTDLTINEAKAVRDRLRDAIEQAEHAKEQGKPEDTCITVTATAAKVNIRVSQTYEVLDR
jgi:hypothetical protein